PRGAGQNDRGELGRAVRRDERPERLAQSTLGQVAGNPAGVSAVEHEIENASQARGETARETLERDADVVANIEAEHRPVVARVGHAADRLAGPRVHLLELRGGRGVDDGQDEVRLVVDEHADDEQWRREQHGCQPNVRAVRAHSAWKIARDDAPQRRRAELALLIDDLVRVGRQPVEPIEQVRRIRSRSCEREVLARAPIERRDALTAQRLLRPLARAVQEPIEVLLELLPFGLIQRFESERRHARLPMAHCATPSTRRVTLGPALPPSPDTAAASAASSSSRSPVNVGARAARATIAAWSLGASGTTGVTGATLSSLTFGGRCG